MSLKLKRFAQIAGASAILCLALGKYFDSRCESSCLLAAGKASSQEGNFRIGDGDFYWTSDESDGGSGSQVTSLTPIALPDVSGLKAFEIRVVSTDVWIRAGDKVAARAADYRSDKAWKLSASGESLLLDLREKGPGRLEIDVPAGFNGRLEVSTVSGELGIGEKLDLGQLHIQSTSGNIDLASWPKESFRLNTVSGDLSAKSPGNSPKIIDIKGVSADIELRIRGPFERFDSKTVSGDVSVKLEGKPDFSYRFHSISGDFIGVPGGVLKEGIANREMEGKLGEPKDSRLEFESISGDFELTL